jgi:hypothetical protein
MKLHDYDSTMYNNIPLLGESADAYEARQLTNMIDTSIRDIFLKHKVHSRLILLLVHRHFDFDAREKPVNVENVGMPWHMDKARAELLPSVIPTQWQFHKDGVVPTEFTHAPEMVDQRRFDADGDEHFHKELHAYLEKQDVLRYFGVGLLEPDDKTKKPPIEFTEGRASVALPFQVDVSRKNPPEVSWFFDPDPFMKRGCTRCCHSNNGGHLLSHTATK